MKSLLFLTGALALALVPGALLLPGCGGGGNSSPSVPADLPFSRTSNVEFPDSPQISGILTVNFADTAASTKRATGTLQIYDTPDSSATPRPLPADAVSSDPLTVLPANATYILVGQVLDSTSSTTDYTLDLRGSYQGTPRFTLRGDFVNEAIVTLNANFESGASALQGRIINVNDVRRPGTTATPLPGNTPLATATPVANATPLATATPIANSTPFATATPIIAPTAIATATPIPPSPPGNTGGEGGTPPMLP